MLLWLRSVLQTGDYDYAWNPYEILQSMLSEVVLVT